MKIEKFSDKMKRFEHFVDMRTAFDDFLTMSIAAFGQNPITKKSYDEDLYLETIAKYKNDEIRFEFPKLQACLINEMTERIEGNSEEGWDVLGEFYEQNLQRKGLSQFFTPWPICTFMAKCAVEEARKINEDTENSRPLRIIDPACGSGRMLLTASRIAGPRQEYYAIDIDHTCIKMTALNLFLSGLFRTESMCGNALLRDDFKVSYATSFLPFGIFRIQDKTQSRLWHMLKNTWESNNKVKEKPKVDDNYVPPQYPQGSQLNIF